MRVIIWGNSYPRIGGIETFVAHLTTALHARGIAVGLVSDAPAATYVSPQGAPVWTVPMLEPIKANDPGGMLDAIRTIRNAIRDFAPDVIHYNMSGAEMMLIDRVLQSIAIPTVTTLHNHALGSIPATSLRRLFGRCGAVTAVSEFVRDCVQGEAPDPDREIIVIPNAIPAPTVAPRPYPANKHVLALGRMVADKGFDTLVEAFPSVLAEHPDARLTIAGNGPERAPLQQRAVELGVPHAIAFPGWTEPAAVQQTMADAAVVAMPSRWQEPFGLVALEAGHAARPCVASRVGGLPSIIVDGETGRLVPSDQPAALATAIAALLADPAEAEATGRRAKQRMTSVFDFDRMADAYVESYQRACGG